MRGEKCEVFANHTELVIIFALLKLVPRISHLRAFKGFSLKERLRVFDLLPVHAEEDVMMQRLGHGSGAAEPDEEKRETEVCKLDLHYDSTSVGPASPTH